MAMPMAMSMTMSMSRGMPMPMPWPCHGHGHRHGHGHGPCPMPWPCPLLVMPMTLSLLLPFWPLHWHALPEAELVKVQNVCRIVAVAGFDFKTKFHKNPQLATTYGQKAPIAQYVRRIDAQIAVRFCAICSIYIMPKGKALGDISTVSILIGGCVFYSPSLPCVCRHFDASIPTLHRGKMANWRHTQCKLGE